MGNILSPDHDGPLIEIVTVFHKDENAALAEQLHEAVSKHEDESLFSFIGVDNREVNRGFSRGSNYGALQLAEGAPYIGFLNPDCVVKGPFIERVVTLLRQPEIVITGCRFGKPQHELRVWGVKDWVCGAALFVERDWFEEVGGFDERFVWGWEETDLIRRAEVQGRLCRSTKLPIHHVSPSDDTPEDIRYKHHYFDQGQVEFYRKWGRTRGRF